MTTDEHAGVTIQPDDEREQPTITLSADAENPFQDLARELHDDHGWSHREIETAMHDAEIGVSTAILTDIQGGDR